MKPATVEKLPKVPLPMSNQRNLGRPKTRKPKPGELTQLSIALDGALIASLDAEADKMSAERPGLRFTRTDVVRVALHDWLASRKSRVAK